MKLSLIVCVILITVFLCGHADAWWGGGKSSSSSSSGSSSKSKGVSDAIKSSAKKASDAVKSGAKKAVAAAKYAGDFAKGSFEMGKAYVDMRRSNWKESDKYFHARGNYDAAKHGPGGKKAAEVISNTREAVQQAFGESKADSDADQKANKWGRSGKDPNHFRPNGLPKEYRR